MNPSISFFRRISVVLAVSFLLGGATAHAKQQGVKFGQPVRPASMCASAGEFTSTQSGSLAGCAPANSPPRFEWSRAASGLIQLAASVEPTLSKPTPEQSADRPSWASDVSTPLTMLLGTEPDIQSVTVASSTESAAPQVSGGAPTRFDSALFPIGAWLGLIALAAVLLRAVNGWDRRAIKSV